MLRLPARWPVRPVGLGVEGSCSVVWPFVLGMVAWAFGGDLIKSALGMSQKVAAAGVERGGGALIKKIKGKGEKE